MMTSPDFDAHQRRGQSVNPQATRTPAKHPTAPHVQSERRCPDENAWLPRNDVAIVAAEMIVAARVRRLSKVLS